MKPSDFINEPVTIAVDAERMHKDHEVQMAREQCYNIARNAIKLHELLKTISEDQGIDGWVASKITLAEDYCRTVREYLEYEIISGSHISEDASAGATGSSSIAAAPAAPLSKKKRMIKRKQP